MNIVIEEKDGAYYCLFINYKASKHEIKVKMNTTMYLMLQIHPITLQYYPHHKRQPENVEIHHWSVDFCWKNLQMKIKQNYDSLAIFPSVFTKKSIRKTSNLS